MASFSLCMGDGVCVGVCECYLSWKTPKDYQLQSYSHYHCLQYSLENANECKNTEIMTYSIATVL